MRRNAGWALVLVASLAGRAPSPGAEPAPVDRFGDPLPEGARARLGTVRFRHGSDVLSLAFSPDGKLLASGGRGEGISLWDAATGKEVRRVGVHPDLVNSLCLSPDGKVAAAGGRDCGIRLWDVATGTERCPPQAHQHWVCEAVFSPDGRTAATASSDRTVRLWEAGTGKPLHRLAGHRDEVWCLAYSPDGKVLVSGGLDNIIRVWDPASGASLRVLEGHRSWVRRLAFTPDGRTLASAGGDSTVRLWDAASWRETATFPLGDPRADALAFTPDGGLLALGCNDGTIRVLALPGGKEVARLQGLGDGGLAFSPDGRTLASGGTDSTIRLWETATWQERCPVAERIGFVKSVAFDRTGRTLASAETGGLVRLWEVRRGGERLSLRGHRGAVLSVAFSADGRRLISGGDDGTALVWDRPRLADPGRDTSASAEDLEARWKDLSAADAGEAFRAARGLYASPDRAVGLAGRRLKPAPVLDPATVARRIADLRSEDFSARERAGRELGAIGECVGPQLRKALEEERDPEARRRLDDLIGRLAEDERQAVRAVEVLEWVGTPDARRLLAGLAAGAPDARLTREAKAALARLGEP
jgi:WD40 repeat protein